MRPSAVRGASNNSRPQPTSPLGSPQNKLRNSSLAFQPRKESVAVPQKVLKDRSSTRTPIVSRSNQAGLHSGSGTITLFCESVKRENKFIMMKSTHVRCSAPNSHVPARRRHNIPHSGNEPHRQSRLRSPNLQHQPMFKALPSSAQLSPSRNTAQPSKTFYSGGRLQRNPSTILALNSGKL